MKHKLPAWWMKWAITADEVCTRMGQSFGPLPRACRAAPPLQLSDLEPRLLFSATPIDVASLAGADATTSVATIEITDSSVSAQSDSDSMATLAEATSMEQQLSEIVFVDSAVPDLQQLLDGLDTSGHNIEVFVLDANRDGVDQITEVLNSRSDVSSIHVVSHARDGAVRLGNTWLSEDNLAGYAGQLASWQNALSSNADLLFYGCDLAGGDDGRLLLDALSALTGADVAASIDNTGSASLGGDWDLEYKQGSIESGIAFTTDVQANWNELLVAPEFSVRQEFLVNTTTVGIQTTTDSHQAVAVDASGNYIVVWSDYGADGSDWGVFAQRFDSNGNALGSEFQVNVFSTEDQKEASVAMNASGQFVIAYTDYSGSDGGIWMRRFEADGTAIDASDVHVNVGYTAGNQHSPTVAINASAQVVIAWQSDGAIEGVYAQAFDFTTTITGNDLSTSVISIETGADANDPSVAINDSGRYVVVWDQGGEVYARRYDHGSATALSDKHDMNQLSDGSQAAVAIRSDNTYVVTFRSNSMGIYVRAANADGSTNGSSIAVTNDTSAQAPTISMDSSGAYIIGFQNSDSSGQGVYARKYWSNNNANGSEFLVNTTTDSNQQAVSLASLDGANFIAVWSGKGTQTNNADTSGVFAKQFGTAIAHTVTVNTTLDAFDGDTSSIDALLNNRGADGLISLREAIVAANNTNNGSLPDKIHFNIAGSGPHTIDLLSALPAITGAVIIDGTTETDYAGSPIVALNGANAGVTSNGLRLTTTSGGSTIRGLVIQAFSGDGILIESSNNLIVGNFIGTDFSGTTNIGNGGNGIWIKDSAANNTVGGTALTDRNVIAGNGANGIFVSGSQATGNLLVGNRITENGGLGIALDSGTVNTNDYHDTDSGANAGQNYPTITLGEVSGSDLIVGGTLGTSPNATFMLHFYASSAADGSLHGEAGVYLGSKSVTTDSDGNGAFNVTFNGVNVTVGQYITATATDSSNNTSEFSQNYVATLFNHPPVADAGGPYTIDEGSILVIDASGSSDSDPDTLTYQWDLDGDSIFGEAGEPNTALATVTWATLAALGVTAEGVHTIRVQVDDGRGESDIQSTTFTITNVAPVFTSSDTASVIENQVLVQTVSASDPVDTLTYSITGGADAGLFEIVESTGVLSFKIAPDFESPQGQGKFNTYLVQVTASDGTATTSQLVTVSVVGINESPSAITLSNATVAENATGAVIGNVAVVDPDSGDSYKWSVDDSRFRISGNKLRLKPGRSLDHETEPTLTLTITAKDKGGAGFVYSESFTITVDNVDEAPTDISLSRLTLQGNSPGATVGTLAVTDPDVGDSHTWSVSDSRFTVVEGTLKLKPDQRIASHIEPTVDVTVTATDASGLSLAKTFTITVKAPQVITPVNPAAPPTGSSSSGNSSSGDSSSGSSSTAKPSSARPSSGDGNSAPIAESKGETPKDLDSGSASPKDGESAKQTDAASGDGNNAAKGPLGVIQAMMNENQSEFSPTFAPVVFTLASTEESKNEVSEAIDDLTKTSVATTRSYDNESTSAVKTIVEERVYTQLQQIGVTGSSSLALHANYAMMTHPGEMWQELDQHKLQVESQIQSDLIVVGTAGAAASSFTVGVIAWGLRTGFLASGLIAQLPAWRSIDPLLIMQGAGQGDNESLEDLMKRRSDALDDVESSEEAIA